jgi:hypothetical protein
MIYHVIIPDAIYQKLEDTMLDYDSKRSGLGLSFFNKWESVVESLKSNPFLFQKKTKYLRTVKISGFPYLVVYEIVKGNVYVYRLIEAKRHPKKILKR